MPELLLRVMEDEIISGTLTYLKPSTLGKKWNKKWAALYKRSAHGTQRLELYDTKESFEKKAKKHVVVISLEKCTNVVDDVIHEGKRNENVIRLNFASEDKQQVFAWDTSDEMAKWFKAISSVVFTSDYSMDGHQQMYEVKVKQNEITVRLDLDGVYLLSVTPEEIDLIDPVSRKSVIKWPLRFLRKYGRDRQEFSLEAGRRCPSGPGMFYFITDQYNAIFQEVESNVKRLASQPHPRTSFTSSESSGNSCSKNLMANDRKPPGRVSFPSGGYEDPFDFQRDFSNSEPDDYTYNEPVNVQPHPVVKPKPRTLAGGSTGPKKPPRQIPASFGHSDVDTVYSDTVPPTDDNAFDDDLTSQYSHLNLGATAAAKHTDYDSISFAQQWKPDSCSAEDVAYATTNTFSARGNEVSANSDAVYDHVKR